MELLLVFQPGKPGFEVFITEGAFKRPVLAVQDHVLLQMRFASEGLETDLIQRVQRLQVGLIHHYSPYKSHGCKHWLFHRYTNIKSFFKY